MDTSTYYNRPIFNGLFFLLLLVPGIGFTQKSEDLRRDTAFFRQQGKLYQLWLDKAGLGEYITYADVGVRETKMAVFLKFREEENLNLVVSAWDTLKASFEKENILSLEQQLLYKASSIMEVPQNAINVELYQRFNTPLFSRVIYSENGQLIIDKNDPRSKIEKIHLSPGNISSGKELTASEIIAKYGKADVFDCIFAYAQERFTRTSCKQRNPTVERIPDEDNLRFEVTDLCKEVLADETSTVCSWLSNLGVSCNWAKREMLTFTVAHEETAAGIRITLDIDGKIGSGYYKNARRGSYFSMEIERDEELTRYAGRMNLAIRKRLLACMK